MALFNHSLILTVCAALLLIVTTAAYNVGEQIFANTDTDDIHVADKDIANPDVHFAGIGQLYRLNQYIGPTLQAWAKKLLNSRESGLVFSTINYLSLLGMQLFYHNHNLSRVRQFTFSPIYHLCR